MVLAGRRPRTVLGCLVGRACPAGRCGLAPLGWLPLGLAGPAVPVRSPGHGRSGGSSPAAGPLAAAGHACPSPRPVAERTPADHHRRGMMHRDGGGRGSLVLQGGEPVLADPRARPALPPTGTASRAWILPIRACRPDFSARRFRTASCHWSSLVRVIAPAHRDDDSAVSARFLRARDAARPSGSSRPSAHRAARSRPASDPRCEPTARSTASSCGDTRSRARTRAPPGAASTKGPAIGRSGTLTRYRPVRSPVLLDTRYKPDI
jgi:hypothetical protein